jgi:glycerol-3-phosphate dehydrogenase (NAD+)
MGKIRENAKVISLVKGLDTAGGLSLFSAVIEKVLGKEVSVLMGANVADEVARGKFCETTIASRDPRHGEIFKLLFENSSFRVEVIDDVVGTELCGALKNIVAVAAGFSDGLGFFAFFFFFFFFTTECRSENLNIAFFLPFQMGI